MKFPSPNRLAVYVAAVFNITAALVPVLTDIGATDLLGPVAGVNALALMFLKGWQQYEKAEYQDSLHQRALTREHAAQQEAAASVSRPASRVKLPR